MLLECGLTSTRKRVLQWRSMKITAPPQQPMLAYVRERLEAWKGRWAEVAEGTEISKRTIEKIASGEHADPGVSRVQKLHDWFREQEKAAA